MDADSSVPSSAAEDAYVDERKHLWFSEGFMHGFCCHSDTYNMSFWKSAEEVLADTLFGRYMAIGEQGYCWGRVDYELMKYRQNPPKKASGNVWMMFPTN